MHIKKDMIASIIEMYLFFIFKNIKDFLDKICIEYKNKL